MTLAPRVYIVIGPAGSGKTGVARLIAGLSGAAYIDKDTACTRLTEALLDLAGTDPSERDLNPYYQSVVMDLEYATILDLAADNLRVGRPVVLDAPFGRYFFQPDYLAEVTYRHNWPADVELVVVRVQVDSETARERVRARGCARDRSKLADWDTFWKAAEANECRWSDGRRLVFDNRADGLTADEVARALAGLDRSSP
ncbi:AAA family ATPase [Streptomyces sp. cg40]|uniref:AAA family ATPase n=1 Tax=Streptomyces sp. cg40 TaxID=3419764 RepID=UPI003D05B1C1